VELVEATAEDPDALVDRWYSLAKSMESYDELNQLVYTDVDDISKDGFRNHLDAEEIQPISSSTKTRLSAMSSSVRDTTRPANTRITSAS